MVLEVYILTLLDLNAGTISTLYNNGSTGDVLRLYHENTAVTAFSIWGVGAQRGFITSPVSSNGLIFGTASTERMRLAANGNFGIGTSSPNDYGAGFVNLQINSTTGGIIQATYGGTTAIAEILTTSGEGRFGTRTNHPMILKTNNTERMRIDSNGTMTLLRGDTNGTRFGFDGSASYIDAVTAAVSDYAPLVFNAKTTMTFRMNSSERMRLDSSGNLGIGRGSTGSQLDVYATSGNKVIGNFEAAQGGFSNSVVKILNTLGSSSAYDMLTVQTDSDADAGGPYTLFKIRGDGNVGIGTSSPDNKFHVNGGITSTSGTAAGAANAAITLYYDTGNDYGVLSTLHNGVSWKPFVVRSQGIIFQTSNDGEAARIDSSGNVLIGTSTSDKQLTLYSATDASQGISLRNQSAGTSAASYISMGNDSDALDGQIFLTGSMNTSLAGTRSFNFLSNFGAFGFYRNRVSPVATMVMDTSGNVGIGTSSPVTTLDVAGTARATQGTPYTTYTANTKTLALTDNGYYTRCSNTTLITITIPNNSTVAFPLGSEIVFFQAGSGNVLFANAAGVTLNSKESNKNLTGQYSAATLKKIATNTWDLIGDLA
jgi:hypothetical protein